MNFSIGFQTLAMAGISGLVGFQLGFWAQSGKKIQLNSFSSISSAKVDHTQDFSWSAEEEKPTVGVHLRSSDSSLYKLAQSESLGFFDDIPKVEWELMKRKVHEIFPNVQGGDAEKLKAQQITANVFFQDHYEPDFTCRHERRIGQLGDGGKWVCDPHRLMLDQHLQGVSPPSSCLVYSVGSNGETSFEQAIKREIGDHCEIHSFDMANYTEVVEKADAHFHQWGISSNAMVDARGRQYKTLRETVEELGHVGRTIDIFKIDCEGCEWASYPSFFDAGVEMRQVLIELHSSKKPNKESINAPMPMPDAINFFEAMYQHGYVIFHKEVNIRWWQYGQCIEYAFLKLHPDFFKGLDMPKSLPALSNVF